MPTSASSLLRHATTSGRATTIALAALAVMSYLFSIPFGWGQDTPLPWDQAGHYHEAVRLAGGLTTGDQDALRSTLLGADLYPPGHTVVVGAWMALTNASLQSWIVLGLLVHVGTVLLLARAHWFAGVAFLLSPLLISLAPSVMVEPVACLLLAAALAVYPALGRETWARTMAFGLLTTGVLLTKYNIGLPLLPAALIAAAVADDRRTLGRVAVAMVAALALWMLFLMAQDDGWASFLRFARNRANAADQGILERLGWYARVFAGNVMPGWPAAVMVCALPAVGIARLIQARRTGGRWEAGPPFVLALAYVLAALAALVRHDYLLSRNLIGPSVALLMAVGWVLASWPQGRGRVLVVVPLLVLLASTTWAHHASRRDQLDRMFPPELTSLAPLSRAVAEQLTPLDGRVRLVGTFNEFSPGWVHIIRRRAAPRVPFGIDAAYPLASTRSGRDPRWVPEYDGIVDRWSRDGTGRVIALLVTPGSPFDTADYRHWNAWKANLALALGHSAAFTEVERRQVTAGIELVVFDRLH